MALAGSIIALLPIALMPIVLVMYNPFADAVSSLFILYFLVATAALILIALSKKEFISAQAKPLPVAN